MIDCSQFPRKNILCVDMKSFYASVSAVTMGLNPMTCYLAVVELPLLAGISHNKKRL